MNIGTNSDLVLWISQNRTSNDKYVWTYKQVLALDYITKYTFSLKHDRGYVCTIDLPITSGIIIYIKQELNRWISSEKRVVWLQREDPLILNTKENERIRAQC